MMTRCALSLSARRCRIWDSQLLRPLLMLSQLREFCSIDDVGWSWVLVFYLFNDDQLCLFALCVRPSYLKFWTFKIFFDAQWIARILMALKMLAEAEFLFVFLGQWWPAMPFALCMRASYLRFWTFKATVDAQWIATMLRALTMLAEVEFLFFFCPMMTRCALSLCACGRRIKDSELLRSLLILSELWES